MVLLLVCVESEGGVICPHEFCVAMITPVNVEGYDECLCVCVVISRVSVIGLRKRLGVAVR